MTFTFEGLVPAGQTSEALAGRIPGLTFFDAAVADPINIGNSRGSVSVPVLHVTNNESALRNFRPVFLGLRSSQPIARIAADNDVPPNTSGSTIIFDDLTLFPPPPPPVDSDDDGVLDAADNCRDVPNPEQTDTDRDGFGNACDPDDDGDGIADVADRCPLENPAGLDADRDGCVDRLEDVAPLIENVLAQL